MAKRMEAIKLLADKDVERVRLSDVADVIRGVTYKKDDATAKPATGLVAILRANNIQDRRLITDEELVFVPKDLVGSEQLLRKGDVVIATSSGSKDLVGKAAPLREDWRGSFGAFCAAVRPKEDIEPLYLAHFFESPEYKDLIRKKALGVNINNLRRGDLEDLKIPLAPLPEQRRIVSAIETQLGRLDAAVARLHAAKDKLKRYRQAVLHEVFSEEWDTARLDEVCLKIQDGSHFSPKEQFSEPANGRYLYITSKNIRNGYMDLSNLVYVTKEYFDSIYPRCKPELNDVLLTKDGANTGNVTMNTLEEPYALLSSVCLLKPDRSKLMPEFLMYFIQSPDGFKQLTGKMTGTAIKRIILERIREAPIPLPTLAEQKQLVEYVATRFDAANETESTLDTQLLQAGRLRQAVLKRAFEGRLV